MAETKREASESGYELGSTFSQAIRGDNWALYQLGQIYGQWQGIRDVSQNNAFAKGFMEACQENGLGKKPKGYLE